MISKIQSSICLLGVALTSLVYANQTFIEVKGGYYLPVNRNVGDVYPGNGIYGAEIDHRLWKNIFGCLGASYFTTSGKTPGSNYATRLSFVPIDIGLKGIYDYTGEIRPYVGASVAAT